MALRFHTITKANVEIERLEAELHRLGGHRPEGKRILHIIRANERIDWLEDQISMLKAGKAPVPQDRQPAPHPKPGTRSAQLPALPMAQKASLSGYQLNQNPAPQPPFPRETLMKLSRVFPSIFKADDLTDLDLWAAIEKNAFQSFIRIPGMRTDAELSELYWRIELQGLRRVESSSRAGKILELIR